MLLALTAGNICIGQSDNKGKHRVVQFSGILVDASDLTPIPFGTIRIVGTNRGVISNANGFFTFVALTGDVVAFSSIGYQSFNLKISDTLKSDNYSVVQSLVQDTIMLAETVIYPWPSKDKFREAFVKLELPETDADILRRNFNLAAVREQAKAGKMDANMNYRNLTQQRVDQLYYKGQMAPNNLLNPFAWLKFVKKWQQQKKQDKIEKQEKEFDDYGSYPEEH